MNLFRDQRVLGSRRVTSRPPTRPTSIFQREDVTTLRRRTLALRYFASTSTTLGLSSVFLPLTVTFVALLVSDLRVRKVVVVTFCKMPRTRAAKKAYDVVVTNNEAAMHRLPNEVISHLFILGLPDVTPPETINTHWNEVYRRLWRVLGTIRIYLQAMEGY